MSPHWRLVVLMVGAKYISYHILFSILWCEWFFFCQQINKKKYGSLYMFFTLQWTPSSQHLTMCQPLSVAKSATTGLTSSMMLVRGCVCCPSIVFTDTQHIWRISVTFTFGCVVSSEVWLCWMGTRQQMYKWIRWGQLVVFTFETNCTDASFLFIASDNWFVNDY